MALRLMLTHAGLKCSRLEGMKNRFSEQVDLLESLAGALDISVTERTYSVLPRDGQDRPRICA